MDWWPAYLALGALVGFLSGLLGIGGGSAMVPVLAFIYAAKGFPATLLIHLALGTAMSTMVFTAIASVRGHQRHQAVNWRIVGLMAPGILAGTFGGALLAGALDLRVLTVIFTALIYYLAAQMLLSRRLQADREMPGPAGVTLAAAGIGAVSSLTATGGAALVVAFLARRGIGIHDAIGTAAAIGWPLAVAGTIGYVIAGWNEPALPDHTLGFVYLPAMLWIVGASVVAAPLGARVAHRVSGPALRKAFAVVLLTLATKMLWTLF